MVGFEQSRTSVRHQDVQVLIDVVAAVTGNLVAGEFDAATVDKLAERFVNAGVLDREADGDLPSPGKVGRALEDLVQRLRYAYGDYATEPQPEPYFTAHVLKFSSQAAALKCRDDLPTGAVRDSAVHYEGVDRWLLFAFYSELPPDPGFSEREAALRQTANRHGGRYTGSQGDPH